MKNQLIAIFTLSMFTIGCSSMYHANNQQPKHQKVLYPNPFEFTLIDSVKQSKNDIYVKAYEWMAKTFTSANSVIQMQDKDAGRIIGKGVIAFPLKGSLGNILCTEYIHYTISIVAKEGKYKCTITDFDHEGCYSTTNGESPSYGSLDNSSVPRVLGFSMQGRWDEIKSKCYNQSNNLLTDLKNYMHSKGDDF